MPSILRCLCVLALALSASAVASPSGQRLPDDDGVRARMRAFVEDARGAPGVVVAVRDVDGRRSYAHGRSGLPSAPEMDPSMRFEIGSITKGFNGMLLAEMIARDEVSADQTLGELMPGGEALAPEVAAITLEDLATHHSGLPRLPLSLGLTLRMVTGDPYRGSTPQELFDAVGGLSPGRVAERRGRFAYSNLGSALLGQLLAHRAQQPYERLLQERVLTPLGIVDAAYLTQAPPDDVARGHLGGQAVKSWRMDAYTPAGGLLLDAGALLDLGERMLADAPGFVAESMHARRTFGREGRSQVGLGWFHDTIGGQRVIWHNGGTSGTRSFLAVAPEHGWVVVALANDEGDVDGLAARVLDPGRPLQAREVRWLSLSLTLLVLVGAPLLLFHYARPAAMARLDRVRILDRIAAVGVALLLVRWLGNWIQLPFVLWWLSLACSLAAAALLLRRMRERPWLAPGRWRFGHVFSLLVSAALLAALLWWWLQVF